MRCRDRPPVPAALCKEAGIATPQLRPQQKKTNIAPAEAAIMPEVLASRDSTGTPDNKGCSTKGAISIGGRDIAMTCPSAALTAAMIVFVDCMKELPATLLLRPFNFDTLATHVYEFASDEMLGEASLGSLTIVGVGLIPVMLLSRMISRTRLTLGESATQN